MRCSLLLHSSLRPLPGQWYRCQSCKYTLGETTFVIISRNFLIGRHKSFGHVTIARHNIKNVLWRAIAVRVPFYSRPGLKCILKNFTKFTGKHLCYSLFFNKVAGLRPETLLKKRLWHRCFPVILTKLLRKPCLQNTSRRLLLNYHFYNFQELIYDFHDFHGFEMLSCNILKICWHPLKSVQGVFPEMRKVKRSDPSKHMEDLKLE